MKRWGFSIIIVGGLLIFAAGIVGNINWGIAKYIDLENKDFYTAWIALFGVIGVALTLLFTQKRISQQEKQQRDERFAVSVTQLGHESESVRLGGIYGLYALAKEYPIEYLNSVCDILCAHIRTTTRNPQYQIDYKDEPSTEIQTIVDFLFKERDGKITIFNDCKKDLSKSYFSGINFINARISNSHFNGAIISKSSFNNAIILRGDFASATISDSDFKNAEILRNSWGYTKISSNEFYGAKISGTNLKFAKITKSTFLEASISECAFWQVTISESNFSYTKMSKNYFSGDIDDETINTMPENWNEGI